MKRLRPAAHAPEVGCLASYGIKLSEGWAMLAALTDKMLKGAPGETPAQQPTKFELAINLKPRTERQSVAIGKILIPPRPVDHLPDDPFEPEFEKRAIMDFEPITAFSFSRVRSARSGVPPE